MSYVAVQGGRAAIERACDLHEYRRQGESTAPLSVAQLREQLHLGVDRVMGEGGLHAPDQAAQALLQAAGDTFEAAFLLRAHRATLPRLGETLAELRIGYVPVRMAHPDTGETKIVGEVLVTEAEVVSRFSNAEGEPRFQMGCGLCLGHNELKAISMGVLDRTLRTESPAHPAEDQEFVLYHSDGIESMGFSNHWKLPHYVDFLSDLDRLRKAREIHRARP